MLPKVEFSYQVHWPPGIKPRKGGWYCVKINKDGVHIKAGVDLKLQQGWRVSCKGGVDLKRMTLVDLK